MVRVLEGRRKESEAEAERKAFHFRTHATLLVFFFFSASLSFRPASLVHIPFIAFGIQTLKIQTHSPFFARPFRCELQSFF